MLGFLVLNPFGPLLFGGISEPQTHAVAAYWLAVAAYAAFIIVLACLARRTWAKLVLGGVLVLAGIRVFAIFQYQPGRSPAPGVQRLWLTQPNVFESALLASQDFMDISPRKYQLLGWTADGSLFFREMYRSSNPAVLAFMPGVDRAPRQVNAVPTKFVAAACSPGPLRTLVTIPMGYGHDGERFDLLYLYTKATLPGPDCRSVAVVSEAVYGPQDVLIFRAAE
jgi:hypothetical protein